MKLNEVLADEDLNEIEDKPELNEGESNLNDEVEAKGEKEPPAERSDELATKDEGHGEPPSPKDSGVPIQALLDEREKRQKLEQELERLRVHDRQDEEPIDFLDDPDGAIAQRMGAIEVKFNQRLIDQSVVSARRFYGNEEYDAMEDRFLEEAKANPELLTQMSNHPDPADFVYQYAKSKAELEEAGNIEALREKIRREERERLMKELNVDDVPDSLSDARAANGSQRQKPQGGPTPLDSILDG